VPPGASPCPRAHACKLGLEGIVSKRKDSVAGLAQDDEPGLRRSDRAKRKRIGANDRYLSRLGTFMNFIRRMITRLGVYTASPIAFGVLLAYAALWFAFERSTFDWHAIAVLATWFMTLVIQRAEHRDTQAIHAKLDEILHAMGEARNELTKLDEEEPEEIEKKREHMRKDD
jgi:low affinity Fe/Cu permease